MAAAAEAPGSPLLKHEEKEEAAAESGAEEAAGHAQHEGASDAEQDEGAGANDSQPSPQRRESDRKSPRAKRPRTAGGAGGGTGGSGRRTGGASKSPGKKSGAKASGGGGGGGASGARRTFSHECAYTPTLLWETVRRVLPPDAEISDSALQFIAEAVDEFARFAFGEASALAARRTGDHAAPVTQADALQALHNLGFRRHAAIAEEYLTQLETHFAAEFTKHKDDPEVLYRRSARSKHEQVSPLSVPELNDRRRLAEALNLPRMAQALKRALPSVSMLDEK
jgi:hypothetical protein